MLTPERIGASLLGDAAGDEYLINYTERQNASLGVYVGCSLALLESVMLAGAFLRMHEQFTPEKVISYAVFTVLSLAFSLVSHAVLHGRVSRRLFSISLFVYLWATAAYGVLNSLEDFAEGEQILTFLVCMMVDSCIFAMPPVGTISIVVVSYAAMFFGGFSGGRLDVGSLVNFWISGAVVLMAGLVRYHECRIGAERERRLEHMSAHDALTGLKNRMALRSDFSALTGRDQYVVMCDLDDFKDINDTYGHKAGDAVLAAYGRGMCESFPDGVLYRYGGDEFLLFVPAGGACDIESDLKALEEHFGTIVVSGGRTLHVPLSAGWVRGTAKTARELRDLLHEADRRLYDTKYARKQARLQVV